MAISQVPRLSTSQMAVLVDLPEPSGRNKRSYEKLVDAGLVFRVGNHYERKDDGDTVLRLLRDQGLVAEVEPSQAGVVVDEPTAVESIEPTEPEEAEEPQPEVARVQRTVTIHGPYADGEESFHVHLAGDPANDAEAESEAVTIDVSSREDVIDHLYPADRFEREPDDLPTYLSDVLFGESLSDLPEQADEEDENEEGGDQMIDDPERQKEALSVYRKTSSMRAVGRALGIHPTTAKKLVEAAAAVEAANKPAPRGRASGNPNAVNGDAMRKCNYPEHEGENPIPATAENFAVRKSGPRAGTFVGWCRACNKKHGMAYRASKAEKTA